MEVEDGRGAETEAEAGAVAEVGAGAEVEAVVGAEGEGEVEGIPLTHLYYKNSKYFMFYDSCN